VRTVKRNLLYITGLLFIAVQSISAQKKWALKASAEQAMANKDWFGAEQYYYKLFKKDSVSLKLKYSYAQACRLNVDYDIALKMYNRVAAADNGQKYPLTFYWLGQILKSKQNYKDAKKWFSKFNKLTLKPAEYAYFIKKSKLEEEACDLAQLLINNPLHVKSEHLGESVNSRVSEYAAFEKDSALYFSSLRAVYKTDEQSESYNKIYRAENKKAKFVKAKLIDTIFNRPNIHNANTCFSPDNKLMIISRCRAVNASDFECNLYLSKFLEGKWLPPEKMPEPINQPSVNTTQANFGSIDGKTVLFFASNRPGGEGGLDIWYSLMKEDGTFETPVNAGKSVNTVDDEVSPWFISEKKTLFFSSTYHKGLGGFDVFKSTFDGAKFMEPENAGYPINSGYNDIYYSVNKEATRIYLSSNRVGTLFDGKLNCCNDIFRFNVDTTKTQITSPQPKKDSVTVFKDQLKLLVPLSLYFHNDEPDPRTKGTSTTKSYETTFIDYKNLISSYADAYSKGLSRDDKRTAINEVNSFFTDSLESGFEDLKKFCETLKKVMLNGETVTITFKGYCSPLASSDYNVKLAKRRVSSLRNYFNQYENGWFNRYVNNTTLGEGKIIYQEVNVGELPVSNASDDYKDTRNSIYSPRAAGERKIQILAISFGK
jgi:tetratricopeptide (TPR) repeat protein